jgi:hypothetical protein
MWNNMECRYHKKSLEYCIECIEKIYAQGWRRENDQLRTIIAGIPDFNPPKEAPVILTRDDLDWILGTLEFYISYFYPESGLDPQFGVGQYIEIKRKIMSILGYNEGNIKVQDPLKAK